MTPETPIRDQYNRMAAIYDRRWRGYVLRTLTFLKAWASILPHATVLDVGCGTGAFARLLLEDQPIQPFVGVDLAVEMLRVAAQKCVPYPQVGFAAGRAGELPVADHTVDIVVSASTLHYFPDPGGALADMRRVLKPGGQVIILDWSKDFVLCRVCDAVLPHFDPAYRQCYTQAQLHRMLREAGFAIERVRRVRVGLVWGLMVVTSSRTAHGC